MTELIYYTQYLDLCLTIQRIDFEITHLDLLSELWFTQSNLFSHYYFDSMPPLLAMKGLGPWTRMSCIMRWAHSTASLCVCPFCRVGLSIPCSDALLLLLNSVTWLSDFARPNTKDKTHLRFNSSIISWLHTIVTTERTSQNFFCRDWSLLPSFVVHHRTPSP